MGGENKLSNEGIDHVYDVLTLFSIKKTQSDNSEVDPITERAGYSCHVWSSKVASVSVCSQEFYQNKLRMGKLLANDLILRYYNNEPVVPLGKVEVRLNLYVILKASHPLMSRIWLTVLQADLSLKENVYSMSSGFVKNTLDILIQRFP